MRLLLDRLEVLYYPCLPVFLRWRSGDGAHPGRWDEIEGSEAGERVREDRERERCRQGTDTATRPAQRLIDEVRMDGMDQMKMLWTSTS